MQKINIKKYTKEQMLKMLEEAAEKQEAAESRETELRGQIGALTEKLEENEKALEVHGEDMKAIEKAKNESRELAHLLGKRELELAEAKQRHDDALGEAAHLKGQLKAEEGRAARKDELLDEALHRLEVEKAIAEDYHESLKWCMAHPWRNMWRCMKEHFRF